MMQLFEFLTHAISGNVALALFAAVAWGFISILISPCQLTSIPLIVGFVSGQENKSTRRAFIISVTFSLGIVTTIIIVGVITALMGSLLGYVGSWSGYVVGILFVLIGLVLLGIINLPNWGRAKPVYQRKGILSAYIIGLIFGLAMGPCTFAYMAPILAVVFMAGVKNVLYGSLLILVYAVGHCSVIVFAGTSTEMVSKYMQWNEKSRGAIVIKKICGLLLIIGGIFLVFP